MLRPKGTIFVLLFIGLAAFATLVCAQEPAQFEREAMYYRYLAIASYVKGGSITPNPGAAPHVERWIRDQPANFPPPAWLDRCEFMRDVGPVVQLYDRYWTEVKAR